MLRLTLGLLIAAALLYGLSHVVAKRFGDPVVARFLEHGVASRQYTAESLTAWVQDNRRDARGYAVPILFPVDLLFMACLAALLAAASLGLASMTGRFGGVLWLFALLPAAYLAADLAEDALLAFFLLSPARITAGIVEGAHVLTTLKIWTVGASFAQVVALGILALVWRR